MGGKLGVCGRIGQVVLVIVNILFAALGIAILVAGSLLKFKENLVNGYVSEFLMQIRLKHLETDLHSIISTTAIICIVVGVFIFLLAMVGCCGACFQHRVLLVVYSIVVILILGVQIAAIVFTIKFKDVWQDPVKVEMKRVIKYDYKGDTGTDIITMGISAAFMELKCCGIESYTDAVSAPGWRGNYIIDNQHVMFKAPYFCCKTVITETPRIDDGLFTSVDQVECATNPTVDNSNFEEGCFNALKEVVMGYSAIYLGVGISLLVLELFCVVIACYICCMKGRQNEGKLV